MNELCVLPGTGKNGEPEAFSRIVLSRGEMVAVVGGTGSGKSRFIKDIEQLVTGDSVTGRSVLLDGSPVALERRMAVSGDLIAHLGQNMRFVLDNEVEEFLALHISCRGKKGILPHQIVELANQLTPEPISCGQNLTTLSGGQTRALMIADIAMVCQSPVVLVDEIENAGVDKRAALDVLTGVDKMILVVTHDPHTALLCGRRIRMEGGMVRQVIGRSKKEEALLQALNQQYRLQNELQDKLRKGETLI